MSARELLLLEMTAERVEAVGRVAELEPLHRVLLVGTAAQVAARETGVVVRHQPVVVEVDRGGDGLVQPIAALAILRVRGVVVAELNARSRREPFDGADEVEMLDLAHERDRIAARRAAEAVVEALFLIDRERRCLLGMERAQTDEAAARLLQREVFARQLDEVGRFAYPRHIVVDDPHSVVTLGAQALLRRPEAVPRAATRATRLPARARSGRSSPRRT